MQQLTTITQVTQAYGVSTRTLRYYEQIGLLQSRKQADYAYRVYDEAALLRLRQILLLRRLRIPLRQIGGLLGDMQARQAIALLLAHADSLGAEMEALAVIRTQVLRLARALDGRHIQATYDADAMQSALATLAMETERPTQKEDVTMDTLDKANETLGQAQRIRILRLPPCTVAASHYIGENPETMAGKPLEAFAREAQLYKRKPDARMFGFNHPNPSADAPHYGYEIWVTIPPDMDVPAPLVKKQFEGGLYAAHTIVMGDFHEWELLVKWVTQGNTKYESAALDDMGEVMSGLLEEHLNWAYNVEMGWPGGDENQLDLLFPVKVKG